MPEAAVCNASHQHHGCAPVPCHQHEHPWPHVSGSWGSWVTPQRVGWPHMPFGGGWPHGQRKAWLGSHWVPKVQRKALPPGKGNAGCPTSSARHGWAHAGVLMAWGLTQGKVGCPRSSARHCQGKAECPRCSARGELPFPPHCSTLTTRIGEKYLFFTSVKHWLKGSGEKYLFFPMRNTGQVKRTGGKVPFFADIQVTARPLQC